MSHFIFKAKKATGEIFSGEKDAADRYDLYKQLRENGDEVVEFKEKRQSGKFNFNINLSIFNRVKTIEKINFARNLGSMLEAGLNLSRALSVLERQTKSKVFKVILTSLISDVTKGVTFSEALAKHTKIFPPIFVAMVHAGEQSGTLAESLKVIAKQMDSSYSLDRRIKGALMYPAVILVAMILIGILMFIFVIPTLLKTFTELNVKLPLTTQIVLNISNTIQNQGLVVLAILVLIVGAIVWYIRRPSGKKIYHALILKLPVVGSLVQEINTARTARTLASLLNSGVDIIESVDITATVVQNVHFRSILVKASAAIKKGDLMSKIFNESGKLYPIFFAEMLSVGEETGKTGEMLAGVADYYEEDVSQRTKDMSTVIEPFLVLTIGGAVGFFAISMIQPIYSLVDSV